jgi:flavin-dependent dehydrogenase
MYDAIIVGARCAGSPTAMLLARKGYRVLLVDKATFPSDTVSTHIIWPPGVARLHRWGMLDKIIASNCPRVERVSFDLGPFALSGMPPASGNGAIFAPRRRVLDRILVEAAAEAGAELREGFAVQEIVSDDGRVLGIRGRTRSGSGVTERAQIVIGADGVNSTVARAVGAPEYQTRPALACWYYTYWSGVETDGLEYYVRDGRAFGCIPTNDGLVCVPVAWPAAEFRRLRAGVEAGYRQTLELGPGLAERVRAGRREERFVGMANPRNFLRRPFGPGWALVGDAGYHKDPITAQGISDAFRDAECLTSALDEGLSGPRPLADALADYEAERNRAVSAMYGFTCDLARLEPPAAEVLQLLAALRFDQTETNRFFGTLAGTVSIPEFFAPENIQRIVLGAGESD